MAAFVNIQILCVQNDVGLASSCTKWNIHKLYQLIEMHTEAEDARLVQLHKQYVKDLGYLGHSLRCDCLQSLCNL